MPLGESKPTNFSSWLLMSSTATGSQSSNVGQWSVCDDSKRIRARSVSAVSRKFDGSSGSSTQMPPTSHWKRNGSAMSASSSVTSKRSRSGTPRTLSSPTVAVTVSRPNETTSTFPSDSSSTTSLNFWSSGPNADCSEPCSDSTTSVSVSSGSPLFGNARHVAPSCGHG